MNSEIFGVILTFLLAVALAVPLGKYIAKVYAGEKTFLDVIFNPIEKMFYKVSGIDASREMTWKESLVALLTINLIWFFWGMFALMNQGWLPLNPDGNPSMTADLAYNTTISFVSNTNLQHRPTERADRKSMVAVEPFHGKPCPSVVCAEKRPPSNTFPGSAKLPTSESPIWMLASRRIKLGSHVTRTSMV